MLYILLPVAEGQNLESPVCQVLKTYSSSTISLNGIEAY